jgi:hypothetical protein
MLDDAFELFIVTVLLGVAALYLAYQWGTGLLLSVVNLLPSVLVLLLAKLGGWPPIVALMACVFALPIVGCFVDLVERHGISTSAHLVIADTSMATMGILGNVSNLARQSFAQHRFRQLCDAWLDFSANDTVIGIVILHHANEDTTALIHFGIGGQNADSRVVGLMFRSGNLDDHSAIIVNFFLLHRLPWLGVDNCLTH